MKEKPEQKTTKKKRNEAHCITKGKKYTTSRAREGYYFIIAY